MVTLNSILNVLDMLYSSTCSVKRCLYPLNFKLHIDYVTTTTLIVFKCVIDHHKLSQDCEVEGKLSMVFKGFYK